MDSYEIDLELLAYDQWCEGRENPQIEDFANERGIDDELLIELKRVLALGAQIFGAGAEPQETQNDVFSSGLLTRELDERFRFERALGTGGMGSVWLAEQKRPIQRRVAVKLIRQDKVSDSVRSRFEFEQQALASMKHPNVAAVYESGETKSGLPYFVMEFIQGEKLTDFCNHNKLDLNNRLDLFLQVCEALEHAHQNSLIHRDLKPGNVLVTGDRDTPVAKVIDFGLAKDLTGLRTEVELTSTNAVMGSPIWMSPEQARVFVDADPVPVDTRTDIYSLGIILYELLTNTTPITREAAGSMPRARIFDAIREDVPASPSMLLKASEIDSKNWLDSQSGSDFSSWIGNLKDDLDWIVMKAIEKEPGRRYASVSEFASDIRRFIAGEEVTARPPSSGYRLRKFLRKNAVLCATVAGVGLLLTTATCVSVWNAVQAQRARQVAERRLEFSDKLVELNSDFIRLLDFERPVIANNNYKLRVLDRISQETENLLASSTDGLSNDEIADREFESRVCLANVFRTAGQHERSSELLNDLLETLRPLVASNDERIQATQIQLAFSLINSNKIEDAAALAEPLYHSVKGIRDPASEIAIRAELAYVMAKTGWTDTDEALRILDDLERRLSQTFGTDHWITVSILRHAGFVHSYRRDYHEAIRTYEEALARSRRSGSKPLDAIILNMEYWTAHSNLQNESIDFESFERDMAAVEDFLGNRHSLSLSFREKYCGILAGHGQLGRAMEMIDLLATDCESILGPEHPVTLDVATQKLRMLVIAGSYDEAVAHGKRNLEVLENCLVKKSRKLQNFYFLFGEALNAKAEHSTALELANKGLESGPSDPYLLANLKKLKAQTLLGSGRFDEATAVFSDLDENSGWDFRYMQLQIESLKFRNQMDWANTLAALKRLDEVLAERLPERNHMRIEAKERTLECYAELGQLNEVVRGGEEVLRLISKNKQLPDVKKQVLRNSATAELAVAYWRKDDADMCEFYCASFLDERDADSEVDFDAIRVQAFLTEAQIHSGQDQARVETLLNLEADLSAYRESDSAIEENYFIFSQSSFRALRDVYEREGNKKKVREYQKKLDALNLEFSRQR